jgi:hypothetical protein
MANIASTAERPEKNQPSLSALHGRRAVVAPAQKSLEQ